MAPLGSPIVTLAPVITFFLASASRRFHRLAVEALG